MSLRTWLLDRLRPILGSDEIDPDQLIELTNVKPFEVPAIQAVLSQAGINSQVGESLRSVTWDERAHVVVKQADFDRATEVLADLRGS